ncbi:hypothetical protein [Peptoniphilus indolicus]|uniref:Uncharacterized protein n=2 Tax=Peptoniphilus indolicus TaxID=33030 RepID=G4D2J7_9FIRM|nr:hypothetical protein [Peptoniphilus indolicus]EGY80251.1 hypothetical protein HMPREF9129_0627 [Peptoniphilus indolicus ATCC 29427]SUB75291.1 Uncharacterised protein [Peptoniphilus indolicus]
MKINFNSRKLRKTVAIISLWVMILSSTNVSAIVNRTYRDVEAEVKNYSRGGRIDKDHWARQAFKELDNLIFQANNLANQREYDQPEYLEALNRYVDEIGAYTNFLKIMQKKSIEQKTDFIQKYRKIVGNKDMPLKEKNNAKIANEYLTAGLDQLDVGMFEYVKSQINKAMKDFIKEIDRENIKKEDLGRYIDIYNTDDDRLWRMYYRRDSKFKEYNDIMREIYNKHNQIMAILKSDYALDAKEAREMLEIEKNLSLGIAGGEVKEDYYNYITDNDLYNARDRLWLNGIVNLRMAREAKDNLDGALNDFFKAIGKVRPKDLKGLDERDYEKIKDTDDKRISYLNTLKQQIEQQVEEASAGMEIKPLEIIKEVPNNSPKWNMDVDAEDDDSLDKITMLTKAQIERLNKLGINFDNIDFNDESKIKEIIAKLEEGNNEDTGTVLPKATGIEDRDRIEQNTEKEHYEDVKKTEAAAPIAKVENEGSHLVLQGTISKAEDFKVMEQNIEIEAKTEETGAVASEQASEVKIVEKSEAAQQALRIEQQGKEKPPHSIISPVSASGMGQKVSEDTQAVEVKEVQVLEEQHTDAEQTQVEVDDKRASQVIETAPESIYERIRFNLPEVDRRENLSPSNLDRIHTAIGEFSERSNRTMDMLRNGDKDVSLEDQEKIKRLILNGGNVRKDLDVILGVGKEDEIIDKLVEYLETRSNDLDRIYRQYNPENKK